MQIILLGDFLSLVIHKWIVLASTLGTNTLLHTLPGHFSNWPWEKPVPIFLAIWKGPSQHSAREHSAISPQKDAEWIRDEHNYANIRRNTQQQTAVSNPIKSSERMGRFFTLWNAIMKKQFPDAPPDEIILFESL